MCKKENARTYRHSFIQTVSSIKYLLMYGSDYQHFSIHTHSHSLSHEICIATLFRGVYTIVSACVSEKNAELSEEQIVRPKINKKKTFTFLLL